MEIEEIRIPIDPELKKLVNQISPKLFLKTLVAEMSIAMEQQVKTIMDKEMIKFIIGERENMKTVIPIWFWPLKPQNHYERTMLHRREQNGRKDKRKK